MRAAHLGVHAVTAPEQGGQGGPSHDQEHECREGANDQANAKGHRPIAQFVEEGALGEHLARDADGDQECQQARGGGQHPWAAAGGGQDGHERRQEHWHHHHQDGKMIGQRHDSRSSLSMSSSSMEPYSSLIRTVRASPSAVTAIPTTMAVRMSTWGRGLA